VDWATDPTNSIAAFNIADGLWTEIPPPEGRKRIFMHSILLTEFGHKSHRQRDAQQYLLKVYVKVVVEQQKFDYVRIWKFNEAQNNGISCELHSNGLTKRLFRSLPKVTVNNSALTMIIDRPKGELIVQKVRLPGLHRSQKLGLRI